MPLIFWKVTLHVQNWGGIHLPQRHTQFCAIYVGRSEKGGKTGEQAGGDSGKAWEDGAIGGGWVGVTGEGWEEVGGEVKGWGRCLGNRDLWNLTIGCCSRM